MKEPSSASLPDEAWDDVPRGLGAATDASTEVLFRFPREIVNIRSSVVDSLQSLIPDQDGAGAWGLLFGDHSKDGHTVVEWAETAARFRWDRSDIPPGWRSDAGLKMYPVGFYRYFEPAGGQDSITSDEFDFVKERFDGVAVCLHLQKQGGVLKGKIWDIQPASPPHCRNVAWRESASEAKAPTPAPLPSRAAANKPELDDKPDRRTPHARKWRWLAVGALVLVLCAVGGVVLRRRSVSRIPSSAIAPPATGGLHLDIAPAGEDVFIRWDAAAPACASAHGAVLWVTEDGEARNFVIDKSKLDTGRLIYPASGTNLTFRLEVFGTSGSTSESVKLFRTGRIQGGSIAQDRALGRTSPDMNDQNAKDANRIRPEDSRPGAAPKPQDADRRAVKVFSPPQKRIAAADPVVSVPPALAAQDERSQIAPGIFSGKREVAPPPPAVAAAGIQPAAPARVAPAKPVYQPEPQFSRVQLEQAPAELVVDLDVDEQGRVARAAVAPGQHADAVVIAVTLNAAKRWRYEPAELNGQKVSTKVTVHFVFSKR